MFKSVLIVASYFLPSYAHSDSLPCVAPARPSAHLNFRFNLRKEDQDEKEGEGGGCRKHFLLLISCAFISDSSVCRR